MTVYLVGAGPGDPGLITVRGAEVLARADVVFYDRLAAEPLLHLAPDHAERVAVGKTPRGPSTPQEEINRLLVERGLQGQTVVRLKGGDPFVFGRGSEEAAALRAAGVAFEIVPGVTSAVAAPAYAGVPVTSRGVAKALTVVTGQGDPWAAPDTDWEAVARLGGTVVLLMAVATRGEIAARLMAAGLARDTPVAAVTNGTRAEQLVVRTTLADLGATAIEPPATIVIGAVAGIDLGWFDPGARPRRRVALTREAGLNGVLADLLVADGFDAVECPLIASVPLGTLVLDLTGYDWVAFTSATAVDMLFRGVRDARSFGGTKVAAVGEATASRLRARGIEPDVIGTAGGAALGEVIAGPPSCVLLPQAEGARPELADTLRARGFDVEELALYRTVAAPLDEAARAALATVDAVVFASPSAISAWQNHGLDPPAVAICIGPTTAAAAQAQGFPVVTADEPTAPAMAAAVRRSLGP